MYKMFRIWILLSLYFIEGFSTKICDFKVFMEQYLTNEGFHRNITYEVTFGNYDSKHIYDDCIIGLDQTLPPGVFANSDELEDLRRVDKLSAIPKNRVNIELPAEESQPSNVYLISKLSNSVARMWLPVHARYHEAKAGGGYAHNEIQSATLYLRCPDSRLSQCDKVTSLTTFCTGSSKQKCSWKKIPHTVVTQPLIFQVPVGNTNDYHLVASATLAVVIAGSVYLLKTLHEYKLKMSKKRS